MPQEDGFDVESFRRSHESNTEWNLRRQFILAHHSSLEHNRLLCLANCFINVECYGCTYPEQVMLELKRLTVELGDGINAHRQSARSKKAVKFVKGK